MPRKQPPEPRTFEEVVRRYEALYRDSDYGSHPTTTQHLALNAHSMLRRRGVQSILDVGCGRGRLLWDWQGRGYRIAGTEIVPSLLSSSLQAFDEIYPYSVLDLGKIPADAFDFVTFVDVLDHLQTKEELGQALAHATRIARIGFLVTVNAEPPTCEQTAKWDRAKWEDVIQRFIPLGLLDVTERKGVRFIAWKAVHNVRPTPDEDAGGEPASDGDVHEAPGGERREAAEGEDPATPREPESGEE